MAVPYLGFTTVQLIALAGSVAGFVAFLVWLFRSVFGFLVLQFTQLDSYLSSDLYSFVSYTLNFGFLSSFFTVYYVIFCTFVISYITLRVFSFCAHVYPYIASNVRSVVNWISGDS